MNLKESIYETYDRLGIKVGKGEEAFWMMENKSVNEIHDLYKDKYCTGFPNITRSLIVSGENSKADLIVPKNIFIKNYDIASFLKIDPENKDHRELLVNMIDTTFKNSNPDDLIMFFNVLRNKIIPTNTDCFVIMTVSYLHLWVMEKSKMYVQNTDFHKDSIANVHAPVFLEEEFSKITDIVKDFGCVILNNTDETSFAPIHIRVESAGKSEIDQIVNSLLTVSKIIKKIDSDEMTKKFVDKGFRVMIRKEREWTVNILGEGKLSKLTKGP